VMPIVMKRELVAADGSTDYMFLACAGVQGGSVDYDKLAFAAGSNIVTSSLAITDTDWHYVSMAIYPGQSILRFMLDDQVDEKSVTMQGVLNAGPLVIGAHMDGSGNVDYAFDGLMDEVNVVYGFLSDVQAQDGSFIPADLYPNARIDLQDVAELGSTWLIEGGYDMQDLMKIAEFWLYGTDGPVY
jgi:hypothetical protein